LGRRGAPRAARRHRHAARHRGRDGGRDRPAPPLRGPSARRGDRPAQRRALGLALRRGCRYPRVVAEKRYLMTPGPTPAPPEVLAAIAQPVIHHRGPDYRELYARVLGRLREIFRTEQEVLLFGGS